MNEVSNVKKGNIHGKLLEHKYVAQCLLSYVSYWLFTTKFSCHRNDLGNLPYLKLCINESMRLYSPVPIICRRADEEYDLQGKKFPKGIVCTPTLVYDIMISSPRV